MCPLPNLPIQTALPQVTMWCLEQMPASLLQLWMMVFKSLLILLPSKGELRYSLTRLERQSTNACLGILPSDPKGLRTRLQDMPLSTNCSPAHTASVGQATAVQCWVTWRSRGSIVKTKLRWCCCFWYGRFMCDL